MNVQSPVFVPNSSCSSEVSAGSNTTTNSNVLASSLELSTPLASGMGWPTLAAGVNDIDNSFSQGSSGKKQAKGMKKGSDQYEMMYQMQAA